MNRRSRRRIDCVCIDALASVSRSAGGFKIDQMLSECDGCLVCQPNHASTHLMVNNDIAFDGQ